MPLPTDYQDATTPTGALTELPATTSRGVNAITAQVNANTTAIAGKEGSISAGTSAQYWRGDKTWQTLNRAVVPEAVTVSSAATLTLTTASSHYVHSGTGSTWTMPAVSGNTGFPLLLENRGSGPITLNRAGTDQIWFVSAITSMTIIAGGSLLLVCDGTYWNALSLDLTNNAVGVLPAANGGTGRTDNKAAALVTARTIGGVSFDGSANITQPYDLSLMGFGAATTRAVGAGDNPMGIKLQRACTLTSVTFRCNTAAASGNLVVELRKNGSQIAGTSTTIAAANQVAGGTSTGSWACAAGDIITAYITAVGTTPGTGLVADITGVCG